MMIINFENIPIYGIFLSLSLIINCIIIFIFSKFQKMDKNILLCSLIYEMIGIIVGAKILNLIQVKENTSFYYAGFSAYGGVLGGILALFCFAKLYKIPINKLLNIYIPVLPLLYSVSKLGCFFSGCCYGIEYLGFGNIVYTYSNSAPLGTNLFPVQLVESIMNLVIFIYVCIIYKNNIENNKIIRTVFILCGISKFLLEFFRNSWNGQISSTQFISILFIVIGFIMVIIEIENKNRKKILGGEK